MYYQRKNNLENSGTIACAYYTFKTAYYALEQCSRILPIMLKLRSICKPVCSTNSTFPRILLKSQNLIMSFSCLYLFYQILGSSSQSSTH